MTHVLAKALRRQYDTTFEIIYKADEEKQDEIENNWDKAQGIIILDNASINELYKNDFQKIMEAKDFEGAEATIYKIPRKQKDNKYTNFFRNFKFFYEKLGEFSESQLSAFTKTFLTRCQVIEIKSWQIEQAIAMFNSLNSTGMPLSDADIISAQLYSKTPNENRDDFIKRWQNIQNNADILSQKKIVDIDGVLQQFMYMERARTKEYKTNQVTTPGIRKFYTYLHSELLAEPQKLCDSFEKILAIWDAIQQYPVIKLLLKFNENFKIFLIPYLYRFNPDEITQEKIQAVAENMLRLFALMEIANRGFSSSLFKTFLFNENLRVAESAYAETQIIEDFDQHINNNWKKEDIESDILDYNGNLLVYLNEYLYAKEKGLAFNFTEKTNVEHIMPASGHNIETIRMDAGIDDPKLFEEIVNQLGNKILLEENINKSISNDWFKTKKGSTISSRQGYRNSDFGLANELSNYPKDTWDKEDIDKATRKAARRITEFILNRPVK